MGKAIGRRLAEEGLHVELHDDHFAQGTQDVDWLPIVGERGWVVFTKDTRFRKHPNEKLALLRSGVRAFAFTSGSLKGLQMNDAVVNALPEIMRLLATHKRAFIARITATSDVAILLEE